MTWLSTRVTPLRRRLRCIRVRIGRMGMDNISTVCLDPIPLLPQRLVPPPLLRPQGRALARYVFGDFGICFQKAALFCV